MKRTLLAFILILCLLLCSCAPAISGDHSANSPSSEPSAAPSQPTDPPVTEPTITVPDGTPLTDAELASLQALFQWPSYYSVSSNFNFSTPSELPLERLIREGPDVEKRFTMSEAEKAHLSAISEGFIFLDTARISKDAVVRVLDHYYGLTLEDFPEIGSLVYWETTNCFYYCGGGTVACLLTLTKAVVQEDGTIWVRYVDETVGQRIGAMILKPTEDGYQILSNQTAM